MATLTVIRGDTAQRTFVWEDGDGDPINLAGYTVTFTVRFYSVDTVYTVDDGLTITEDQGRIEVSISPEDTADWPGPGTFKLIAVSPDSPPVVTTIRRGNIRVE